MIYLISIIHVLLLLNIIYIYILCLMITITKNHDMKGGFVKTFVNLPKQVVDITLCDIVVDDIPRKIRILITN
jgi:hypothetical protein